MDSSPLLLPPDNHPSTNHVVHPEDDIQADHASLYWAIPHTPPILDIQELKRFVFPWRETLLPYLCNRFVLVLVGLLANFYILPLMIVDPTLPSHTEYIRFPQALWLMWRHFDSGFYLGIAQYGYWPASTLHSFSNWAFYPLYPLLISLFGHLFGGTSESFILAGLFISNTAALIASIYLYNLIYLEFDRQTASRTILYMFLSPLAFYLSAIYTESLFLMFAIASMYYVRRQAWWLAGLCGGLAALTRSQGFLLTVPLAYEYLRILSDRYILLPSSMPTSRVARLLIWFKIRLQGLLLASREVSNWLNSGFVLLVPAGLLAFMVYARIQTGDLLATVHTNEWGWGRQFASPLHLLNESLHHPSLGDPMNWNFWLLNIILAFVFLGFTVWAFYRLPVFYALYTAVMVILPLSTNQLNSIGRLYLVVFPTFLLLALWTLQKDRHLAHTVILSSFAAFQTLFMVFFILGIHAIA